MLRPIILALFVTFAPAFAVSDDPRTSERQTDRDARTRLNLVRNVALSHSRSYGWLQELTNTIGARVTGSPGADKATRWALKTMRDIGLRQVHAEWWQLPHGWQRGAATAHLISHTDRPLTVTSYGWCGSTKEPSVDSSIIRVTWDQYGNFESIAPSWAGRIVLVTNSPGAHHDPLVDYAHRADLVALATKAGAVGIISRDARPAPPLTHTDPVAFGREIACSLPVLDIAPEDEELLVHLLDSGQPVRVRLSVHNMFSPGPVRTANLVGDIPGSDHAGQVVVLGAHLDSWDLGVGAADDGFGVVAVLGAAEAVVRSGLRPKSTIRIVLFTGEEQGLLGSRAWIDAHRGELANVVAALVMDWGPGEVTGVALSGHDELAADLKTITEAMNPFAQIRVRDGYLTYTDAYSFTLAGLPGLAAIQNSPTYASIGHSAADTLAEVDPQLLVRDSAIFGMLALGLADCPAGTRNPWSTEEISHQLERDGQLEVLRLLGLWPLHGP